MAVCLGSIAGAVVWESWWGCGYWGVDWSTAVWMGGWSLEEGGGVCRCRGGCGGVETLEFIDVYNLCFFFFFFFFFFFLLVWDGGCGGWPLRVRWWF